MSTKALEFIEILFTAISEDSGIPKEIKPCLMGLQTPVIKASTDKQFFTDANHPVRITLLLLASISSSGKSVKELSINISKITDNLIHASEISTEDFVVTNRALLALMSESNKSEIIKNYEAADKQRKLNGKNEELKQLVITKLQEIISDNRIPILAHELTLKIWPQYMFKKCVRYGTSSKQWKEGINTFEIIIEYLQPVSDVSSWQKINKSYEQFVQSVNVLLNDSEINEKRIIITTDALRKAISVNLQKYKSENKNLFNSTFDDEKTENKLAMLPESVKVGEWYDLYTAEHCAANRLKLSLIVEDQGVLVFVDHRGIKGMVKNADVFAEELSRYLSRPVIRKKPRLVESWNELVSKLLKFKR